MRWAAVLLVLTVSSAEGRPRAIDVDVSTADPRAGAAELLGPGAELAPLSVRRGLGGVHVRFRTLAIDGTPVVGHEAAVHLEGDGPRYRAVSIDDRGRGLWTLSGRRRLDADAARGLAEASTGGRARPGADPVAIPAGPYLARPGWRVLVERSAPRRLLEVLVDADDGSAVVRRDLLRSVTGTGWVYRPNPVTVSGDHGLRDLDDGDTQTLTDLREMVTLEGLDGSGFLRGQFADVRRGNVRTQLPSLVFDFTRSQDGFEEVNAYHHIDQAQRHLQALGFTGAKAILAQSFVVQVNTFSEDNSYYDPTLHQIETGTGGVDDAEDGDILVHEYGHAVQDFQVDGFGFGDDAAAIGEGFSDIQAYAIPTGSSKAPRVPRVCLGSWDATAYSTPAECLRRVDGVKHYPEHLSSPDREEHFDGEIWSGAIYEAFNAAGVEPLEGYRLLVESQFLYSFDTTFGEAAEALVRTDEMLAGGAHATAFRRAFIRHGLWPSLSQPLTVDPSQLEEISVSHASPSPIPNRADDELVIEEPGVTGIQVRFATLDMEVGSCADGGSQCDAVYLYDGDGEVYARLGGRSTRTLSPVIPGDKVVVRWVTTPKVQSVGFTIDQIRVLRGSTSPPDAGTPDAGVSTPDARPDRPATGDAQGGCQVGGRSGGGAGSGLAVVALAMLAATRRRHRRPTR